VRIEAISAEPFPIPLIEPFTISRATTDSTRAVLVRARGGAGGAMATGYGEAALPLGSSEPLGALVAAVDAAARSLIGQKVGVDDLGAAIDACFRGSNTARAGLYSALIDARARLAGVPLHQLLGSKGAAPLVTDITLPIADSAHLALLAVGYWERGFRCFKIKVGADLAADMRTVELVARATPEATVLFDANEGFRAEAAVELVRHTRAAGLEVTCFEQPCGRDDHDGLRWVREEGAVAVVADESVRDERDLDRLCAAHAVDGINLKLIKMGGIDRCLRLGRQAQERGLALMVGAMIESRLGLSAMAHVVAALGGVSWVDLDTAFLLASDPYEGGMLANGPTLTLPHEPGLGIVPRVDLGD
jgi:L-alanine-DL-glutamate epimerase-like enolase superfamily enzyme